MFKCTVEAQNRHKRCKGQGLISVRKYATFRTNVFFFEKICVLMKQTSRIVELERKNYRRGSTQWQKAKRSRSERI